MYIHYDNIGYMLLQFKSKHSTEKYRIWIKNLLNNISCNIIIFTSNDLVKFLKESYKHKNIFFIVKPLKELTIFLKYKDIWAEQYRIDLIKNVEEQ